MKPESNQINHLRDLVSNSGGRGKTSTPEFDTNRRKPLICKD